MNRITLLLMVLLSMLGANKVFASHYAAVDIYVDYIGTDSNNLKYRVTFTIYKACEGTGSGQASLSAAETLNWRSTNAGYTNSRSITSPREDTVDQLCPVFKPLNSCRVPENPSGPNYPGFTRRIYTDTVTVPSHQQDWTFYWSSGSRNGAILNLQGASGLNIYAEATINNTGSHWNNSSPRYLKEPIPYLCVNQPNSFVNLPYDPDLDSMITTNSQPLQNVTAWGPPGPAPSPGISYNLAPYNTGLGYSLINPINSSTTYTVNSNNGTATFNPNNTGRYVLAFSTVQYDKETGDYLGRIIRDVQVSVVPCNSPPPLIDSVPQVLPPGVNVIPINIVSICPQAEIYFDINAHSAAGTNIISLTAANSVTAPGSFFNTTVLGGITQGHFSWTPTTADIGDHVVEFIATDTTCNPALPILLTTSTLVTIRVLPGIDAGPDRKICPLGDYPVTINVSGPQSNTYTWRDVNGNPAQFIDCGNCATVNVRPPYSYSYTVTTSNLNYVCKLTDTVNITIDNSNAVIATQDPLVVCRPTYITLSADSVGLPPVSNIPCGTANPQICPNPVQITVGNGINPASEPINTPFYSGSKYHKYQFIVRRDELRDAGLYSGTLSSISFFSNNPVALGTNPITNYRISLKCTRNDKFPTVPVNSDFELNPTLVATVPSLAITPNAWNTIPFNTPYNWDTTQNLLVEICIGATTANTNGNDPVAMVPGSTLQRYDSLTDVCAGNSVNLKVYTQRPVVRFDYCQAPNLPMKYFWSPGTYLDDSTKKEPVAYIPRTTTYFVYTIGRNGCLVRDSLRITVPIHTLRISPSDTSLCVGQPAPLHATGANEYIWYENGFNTPTTLSCNTCADPVATPTVEGDIVYTVVFMNAYNCYDTLTAKLHAYPLPLTNIVNNDTMIKYGQHVNLMVNGAYSYTWTPVGSLNDPNIPNPIATPTESTTYVVYGLSNHQCRSIDSVRVNIDYRDNLLIPSGFTPNQDGKNDVFKVVNVTFQKLMEFRVFNRWGQEVFSTTDPFKGWDGTWKGVDQDLGNYRYIIRVAYPDGYVETYKGDVTLIR